jgi:hypothetical protein
MKLNSMKATPIVKAKFAVTIHIEQEYNMDFVIKIFEGLGEIGIDTTASPGNGKYYIKHYASGHHAVGFDNEEDALMELDWVNDLTVVEKG